MNRKRKKRKKQKKVVLSVVKKWKCRRSRRRHKLTGQLDNKPDRCQISQQVRCVRCLAKTFLFVLVCLFVCLVFSSFFFCCVVLCCCCLLTGYTSQSRSRQHKYTPKRLDCLLSISCSVVGDVITKLRGWLGSSYDIIGTHMFVCVVRIDCDCDGDASRVSSPRVVSFPNKQKQTDTLSDVM